MRIRKKLQALLLDEEGATMLEYGMLATLIAVFCVAAITPIGTIVTSYLMDAIANLRP